MPRLERHATGAVEGAARVGRTGGRRRAWPDVAAGDVERGEGGDSLLEGRVTSELVSENRALGASKINADFSVFMVDSGA